MTTPTALDLSKIDKIAWEAKITDSHNSAITTDTARFAVSNVKFFGLDPAGVRGRMHQGAFRASDSGVS